MKRHEFVAEVDKALVDLNRVRKAIEEENPFLDPAPVTLMDIDRIVVTLASAAAKMREKWNRERR
jgi:hypothetical protein